MTDVDRDTERATEFYYEATKEQDAAFKRLREAVRAGNIEAMRAAYEGKNGFLIGTGSSLGYSEFVVLEEVLKNSDISLELLGVFFNELGGRFMVDKAHNVCVFSMLIQMECTTYITQAEEVERRALRMAEVVRYLVETIGYPIRMKVMYAMRPLTTPGRLIMLAMDAGAWACYTAFAQFIDPAPNSWLLDKVVRQHHAGVTSNYWVARFAAGLVKWEEASLWKLSQRTDLLPEHIELLKAEGQRFAKTRQHMQALLLLQDKGPGNAYARAVMDNPNLACMILNQGFDYARF
jgi:hypothetical protein